ncbi:penicillin-binding protein 2 [Moritella marina ATCC 15381]|uniref:Peptidoglycan D,D-transpeptidase MrdA n=1 Tax=Moritella marina ATCC 15381 TaxID=1202962 RepID=A0A5J6WLP8_MORMI|nr:penicillin-binding protein 2 [Moritella marina]QFI39009.1 penicillin-binding protein 2 [Moritella marina ATCC 15381]
MARKRIALRDHSAETALFSSRIVVSFIFVLCVLGLLLSNLYYLQVDSYQAYKTRSNENRVKLVPLPPNRGLIYDRNGILLAENKPVYSLDMVPNKITDIDATIVSLTTLLNLTEDNIEDFRTRLKRQRRFKLVSILTNLSESQVALFSVQQHKYPGISVNARLKRYYPFGDALTHALGYVARINSNDLKRLELNGSRAIYAATHDIGKQGIERYYEKMLHGEPGFKEVEVNNRGKIVRTLKITPPVPGNDLYLNIDIRLQLKAQKELAGRRGAIVLLAPKTGEILAMISSPSYDPNLFVHGISSKNYNRLLQSKDRPLINRATQGRYPPASTVKPQLAILGLEDGAITPSTIINDRGWFQIPNTKRRFRDWKRWGHGKINVYTAIEQSSDTFFYNLAYNVGIDKMHSFMTEFGFGKYTGIDVKEETNAIMPSRDWKRARYNEPWYQGDTISVGIGQGYWSSTPIQLAKATAIVASRGLRPVPQLIRDIKYTNGDVYEPVVELPPLKLKEPANWQVAKDGMHGVVTKSNGTARRAFANASYSAAGKSGTAQLYQLGEEKYDASKIRERLRDNAMFVAYAPFEEPEISATIILENAGGGSSQAAPSARRLFDVYFDNKKEN